MPLEGLSEDSANFVLFWENDTFSVRGAYNYRGSFLSNRSNTQGNPVFTDDYGRVQAARPEGATHDHRPAVPEFLPD